MNTETDTVYDLEGSAQPLDGVAEHLRVLLIDDDEDSFLITQNELSRVDGADIHLEWAASYKAGLHAVRQGSHDAYLVDYSLGAHNGLELMHQARAEGCLAPIIIMTGQGNHALDELALKEGAADYLVKGEINGRLIERSLRYAVERHRSQEQHHRHEAQLRVLTEQIPAVLWTTDEHLRFTSSSGHGLGKLNLLPNEVVGLTVLEYLRTDDEANPSVAAHRRALAGESAAFEIEWMGRTFHGHVSPMRKAEGRIVGTVGVALDVTEERHIKEGMSAARLVQVAFLPKFAPVMPGYDLMGICHPAEAAGGDYFDYIDLADGTLALVVADVSRHDFGSAMIMADTCRLVRMLARQHADLGVILTDANFALTEDTSSDYFVTLFMARLDPKTRMLTYAAAGHDGYVLDAAGTVRHLPSTALPLGIDEDTQVPCGVPLQLALDDLLAVFTDGFADAAAPDGKMFGTARVLQFIESHRDRGAREILDGLYRAVQEHCLPGTHHDDATAVILKVTGDLAGLRCQEGE